MKKALIGTLGVVVHMSGTVDETVGAELRSEATQSEATNHKTTPTTRTSCLLISQVGVSYALFVL